MRALREATASFDELERGDYELSFRPGGRPLYVSFRAYRGWEGLQIALPLEGRPIALVVAAAHERVRGLPEPGPLGDELDAAFTVAGSPAELVWAFDDAALRAWMRSWLVDDPVYVSTRGDMLELHFRGKRWAEPGPDGALRLAVPRVREALDGCLALRDALVRSFDLAHAEHGRTAGPAAAEAWLRACVEQKRRGVWVSSPRGAAIGLLVVLLLAALVAGIVYFVQG